MIAGVLGRTVQVDKHPFTIIGVAPPKFHGTLVFFSPNFFVPLVNCEQVDGYNYLNDRGNRSLMHGHGTSEGWSHAGPGHRRSELDWLGSGKALSAKTKAR